MKLKTLKDILIESNEVTGDDGTPDYNSVYDYVEGDDLKQVLIEHIKDLRSDNPIRWTTVDLSLRLYIIEWIKHFGNITDKELE